MFYTYKFYVIMKPRIRLGCRADDCGFWGTHNLIVDPLGQIGTTRINLGRFAIINNVGLSFNSLLINRNAASNSHGRVFLKNHVLKALISYL